MPSRERACLQQFGIIHLPNPDLTYIRNPEIETKLYLCPSTFWKLKSGTLLCYFFSPSHLTRNHDANRASRAYIYALEASFSQVAKNCQVFCQTVGWVFLTFLSKIKDGNSICQTAGDALIGQGITILLWKGYESLGGTSYILDLTLCGSEYSKIWWRCTFSGKRCSHRQRDVCGDFINLENLLARSSKMLIWVGFVFVHS